MATYIDTINEDVYSEQTVFVGRLKQTLATIAIVGSLAFAGQANLIDESLAATSEVLAPNQSLVLETVQIQDDILPSLRGRNTVVEVLRAASEVTDSVATLSDDAQITSAVFCRYNNVLIDTFTGASSVFTVGAPTNTLSEVATINGVTFQPLRNTITDEVSATSTVFSEASTSATLTDEVTISGGVVELVASSGNVLEDSATATDYLWAESHGRTVVTDFVWAEGYAWSPEPAPTQAWAASTDTFAMSRFIGPEQHSRHRDVLVGPAGVSRPGVEEFEVALVTGLTDFSNSDVPAIQSMSTQIKRIPYAYIAAAGEAVTVSIHETDTGEESDYEYPVQVREANAARPTRAFIGRGLRSRYWRFGIHGSAGLKIYTFNLDVDAINRRI